MRDETAVNRIAEEFMTKHNIQAMSTGVLHNWNSLWVIDGRPMRSIMVKKLLIPGVMEAIGPDPKAVKQIIWSLLSKISNEA